MNKLTLYLALTGHLITWGFAMAGKITLTEQVIIALLIIVTQLLTQGMDGK